MTTGADVAAVLDSYRMLDDDEYALQAAIAEALSRAGMAVRREVYLTPNDRIDLLVGFVGIEVKVAGSIAKVTRQLRRYSACRQVDELVLVTTRMAHTAIGDVGCPLRVVPIMRGLV